MFIGFANFYQRFIQYFSKIAILLFSLLKTTGLLNLISKTFRVDNNDIIDNGINKTNETIMNLSKNNKSRNLTHMPNIRITKKPIFLTTNTKKAFNHLQLLFIKALILWYFDLKSYIWIVTNTLGYTIDEVLN